VTIPNALLNTPGFDAESCNDKFVILEKQNDDCKAKFVSGDWSGMKDLGQFDLVLASETLYSIESMPSFLDLLVRVLKIEGRALIASKANYFGCSGGLLAFKKMVEVREGVEWKSVKVIEKGVRREILEVRRTN
jgi:ubiquinone/menaquinone biosynthesis C-methylase UbiE